MCQKNNIPINKIHFYIVKYIYTKNADAQKPIIVIDSHIGKDEENVEGIMGQQFLNEFFDLQNAGKTECEVWINTQGGKVMEAMNIAGVISSSPMKVTTLNIGVAASCGGWLQLSGETVKMMDYSIFMCHNPHGGDEDKASEVMTNSIAKLISEGSGRNGKPKLSMNEATDLMNKTTFLTADECYNLGLCDEVIASGNNDYQFAEMNDKWQAGKLYLNTLKINTMSEINLSKITNVLELEADASVSEVAKAISNIKNELKLATDKVASFDAIKNELELAKVKNMEDAAKIEQLQNDLDGLEAEKKAKEDAEADNNCDAMLNTYVNKIGKDNLPLWKETVKTLGLDATKNLLDKMPLNAVATKVSELVVKSNNVSTVVNTIAAANAEKRRLAGKQ